jgi:hypothetical protein
MRATLIEDGGAAAADSAQFFRSPEFLAAEQVTHTLTTGGEGPSLPVIVRPISGEAQGDAISPYGYPGGTGASVDPAEVDWSDTGLVSLFVRDRIGDEPTLMGGTVRSEVQIAAPTAESAIRKRLREQIRRNERRGWHVDVIQGPEAGPEARAAFERAYGETMRRTEAAERYLYPSGYFERLLGSDRSWLLLAGSPEPAAGAIAAASDGYLHYYLGGTAEEALGDSPMKNLFAGMIDLAGELGLPLNLGGGVTPGDSLDRFKQGFANATAAFRTHEIVCDPEAYERLSAGRAAGDFFPAYRA